MRVLVIGGTQFFGRKAVDMLLEKGHGVTVMSRGSGTLPWSRADVTHLQADRNDSDRVRQLIGDETYDVIFDNIAMNAEHVRAVTRSGADIGHYIVMSSGSVYHHEDHVPAGRYVFSEGNTEMDWTDMMKPLHEDAVPLDVDWLQRELEGERGAYRRGKMEAEREAVLAEEDTGTPFTIFRPPQVEGPWDPTRRTEFFARRVADEAGIIVPTEGRGVVFQKVFRDDIAGAVLAAIDNHRAYNRAYNIAQQEILSLERYLYVISDCLGVRPPRIVDLGKAELEQLGDGYHVPIPSPKTVTLERAFDDLDYSPTPYLGWMKLTLDWIFSADEPPEYRALRQRELQMMDSLA